MVELFMSPPKEKAMPAIPQDKPVYRILAEKGFFGPDDTLHPEGEIIVLWDKPNEDMEPLNDMARSAFEIMVTELDESARAVADKNGRFFSGRARSKEDLIANASEDARRVQSLSNPNGVRIMGAKLDSSKRISSVNESDPAIMGQEKGKQKAKIEKLG